MEKDSGCKRTRTVEDRVPSEDLGITGRDDFVPVEYPQDSGCKRTKKGGTQVLRKTHSITGVDDLVLGKLLKGCFPEFPVTVKLVCRRWKKLTASIKVYSDERKYMGQGTGELITTINSSARIGSVAVLEWVRSTYGDMPNVRKIMTFTTLSSSIYSAKRYITLHNAVKGGHLCILQCIQRCYPSIELGWDFVKPAIRHNKKEILAWLIQTPYRYDEFPFIYMEAIQYGRLDMIQLLGPGCFSNEMAKRISINYANCGHLPDEGLFDLMKWVSVNIRPWCTTETSSAVILEKPRTLRMLAEAGCPCSGKGMMQKALYASSSDVIDAVDELITRGIAKCDMSPFDLYYKTLHSSYDTGLKWLVRKGFSTGEIIQKLSDNGTFCIEFWEWGCDVRMFMVTNVFGDEHLRMITESPQVERVFNYFDPVTHLGFFDRFERFMRERSGRDEPVFQVERMINKVLRYGNEGLLRWAAKMGYITRDFVPSSEQYWDTSMLCRVSSLRFMDGYSDRNAEWDRIVDMALAQNTEEESVSENFTHLLDYLYETKRLIVSKKTFMDSIENDCRYVFVWLVSSSPWFLRDLGRKTARLIIEHATWLNDQEDLSDKVLDFITTKYRLFHSDVASENKK